MCFVPVTLNGPPVPRPIPRDDGIDLGTHSGAHLERTIKVDWLIEATNRVRLVNHEMTTETDDTTKTVQALFIELDRRQAILDEAPIADILARDTNGRHIIQHEDVPGRFFHDGPASAPSIRAYLRAGGNPQPLEEFGGSLLRQCGGVKPDGTLDLAVLDAWENRYQSALSELPGLQSQLNKARAAQGTLDKAIADHQAKIEEFRRSPAMLYINHDPMTATEKLFALPNTAEAMVTLLKMAGGDQQGIDGLQKAVVNYILEKVGVNIDQAAEYLAFISRHEKALTALFGAAKMENLHNVAAAIQRSLVAQHSERRSPMTPPRRGWRRLFGD
jgi:hypothetical protein